MVLSFRNTKSEKTITTLYIPNATLVPVVGDIVRIPNDERGCNVFVRVIGRTIGFDELDPLNKPQNLSGYSYVTLECGRQYDDYNLLLQDDQAG